MDTELDIVRDSFRRLLPVADALASRFYALLFSRNPELLALFEGVSFEDQKRRLVRALALIVRHMEQPEFLAPYLRGLGALHLAYGVKAANYPAFAECLIDALAETRGPAWSAEEAGAWHGAIRTISETMIEGADRLG
jgi:hemoglobin-like flavoprotein